jgi:serine O-acetyltransferase
MRNIFSASIGRSLLVVHGFGTIIGPRVTVRNNLTIYHGCIIGTRYDTSSIANATIGNDVIIYAGAKIIGNIDIGGNVVIGANAVVTKDIPAQSIVAGVPGKVIGYRVDSISDKYKLSPDVA